MVLIILLAALLPICVVDAAIRNAMLRGKPGIPKISIPERSVTGPNGTVLPPLSTIYYFNQLIDHNSTSLGTFKQRYWANWEFYKQGGPIVFMTPGEVNAEGYTGYLTNDTINGQIAQQQHGATVIMEHRFFGLSNPYDNLTSQSLELLTIEQAIKDLVYFAQNVDLPMPGGDNVKPNTTRWILVGGSYSGALVSWTMENQAGVFYAGYASSAVVEAITDYYGYFTPIRENMPQNCSSDVAAVISYLDQACAQNNTNAIQNLKETFGLGALSHLDDFAATLLINLFDWQLLQADSGPGSMFFRFCDALEVKGNVSAPATGWGVEHAIQAWGSFWNDTYYEHVCGTVDVETCLGSYNVSQPYWTDLSVNNTSRSWFWLVCNEVGFYQVSPPKGQPTIVSRVLKPIYDERQCVNMFPDKFSSPSLPAAAATNQMYAGGWNINVDRLFFATGLQDPWREATVSAENLNKTNTTAQPIYESNGFHCSDLSTANGAADETVLAVQRAGLEYMKTWLA